MAYYEQPGRTTAIDKDGKKVITVTYIGDEEAPNPGLGVVRSRTATRDVAGQVRTTYQIEAPDPDQGPGNQDGNAVIEVVASVRTVPIEAHPNFAEPFLQPRDVKFIKDRLNTLVSNNDIIDFSSTRDAARAASLFGYLAKGITSYYEPSLVVRKTYNSAGIPPAREIGKIASPNVSIPGVPPGANFLLLDISVRGQPGNYTVTEQYEMSGPGGWDTFLYQ